MTHRAARLLTVVATLLVAAAWVGLPVTPAQAAPGCSGRTGVTVVVDFNELGGGVQGTCVADGGGDSATALFETAGFAVNDQAPRNPGYVCQVGSKPEGCGPPDGDRYWGLWWSNGKDGAWTYSTQGSGALKVPDGGYVAFAWDQVAGNELPSYTPTARTAAPSPTPSPTATPTRQPTAAPTTVPSTQPSASPSGGGAGTTAPTGSSSPTPSATPSTTPSDTPTPTATPTPTDTATPAPGATPSDAVSDLADPVNPTSADADGDDGGLPGWLAPLVIVVLFGAAAVALLLRRRQTSP